jgi:hypothetical protein
MRPAYRNRRRLLGGRRFGYGGGRRPGFRDAFRCLRLQFGFRGGRRLRRPFVGRFVSWRRPGRLLGERSGGRLRDGTGGVGQENRRRLGYRNCGRLLGGRRFGYGGGRQLGFRDTFRYPLLRSGFRGGRRLRRCAVARFRN